MELEYTPTTLSDEETQLRFTEMIEKEIVIFGTDPVMARKKFRDLPMIPIPKENKIEL